MFVDVRDRSLVVINVPVTTHHFSKGSESVFDGIRSHSTVLIYFPSPDAELYQKLLNCLTHEQA